MKTSLKKGLKLVSILLVLIVFCGVLKAFEINIFGSEKAASAETSTETMDAISYNGKYNDGFSAEAITSGNNIYKNTITLLSSYKDKGRYESYDENVSGKRGSYVYLDGVNMCFYARAQENEKIGSTNRRINYSTATNIPASVLGTSEDLVLDNQLGNGVIYIQRKIYAEDENVEEEFLIFSIFDSSGLRNPNKAFQIEGDYKISILFETFEWGGFLGLSKQKFMSHILTFEFKLRRSDSKITLIDNETEDNIQKDMITNSNDIKISFNNNKYIQVYYKKNGSFAETYVDDGDILNTSGKYEFHVISDVKEYKSDSRYGTTTITSNKIETETFEITIDNTAPVGTFDNLRRVIAPIDSNDPNEFAVSAEAEGYVSMSFGSSGMYIRCQLYYRGTGQSEPVYKGYYTSGDELNEAGDYIFVLIKYNGATYSSVLFTTTYYITLIPYDNPEYNKDILQNPYRFNNFVSKWYEVYDFKNERILCMADESEAYEAAMALEFSRRTTKTLSNVTMFIDYAKLAPGEIPVAGEYYVYYNEFEGCELIYFSESNLTKAMNYNAKANSKLTYFDMLQNPIERVFDLELFTNDYYLNADYIFASKHPTIIYKLEYEHLGSGDSGEIFYNFDTENGVGYIEANKYFTKHGIYKITETDIYGNFVVYYVTHDINAPDIYITLNDGASQKAIDGETYSVSAITFNSFVDDLDSQAVIKIGDKYFTQAELNGYTLTKAGVYSVYAYDRNLNKIGFTVIIDGTQDYTIDDTATDTVKVYINPYISTYEVFVDGDSVSKKLFYDEKTGEYYLLFNRGSDDTDINITLHSKLQGEDREVISFTVKATSNLGNGSNTGDGGSGSTTTDPDSQNFDYILYIIIGCAVLALAGISVIFILRKRGNR